MWEDAPGVLGGELLTVFDAHRQLQTSLGVLVIELIEKVPVPFSPCQNSKRGGFFTWEPQENCLPSSWEGNLLDRQQRFCQGWQK